MTPDDLGVDLEHAKALSECAACRKKSDGAIETDDYTSGGKITMILCGTHYDEWCRSPEARSFHAGAFGLSGAMTAFVHRLRTTTYAACWAAKED